MLSTILSMLGGQVVDKLFGTLGTIITQWQQKQISEVEAKKMILTALIGAAKEIEVTYAQELSKTYATMMGAVQSTPMVRNVWAIVTLSQLFVVVWYQFVVPLMAFVARYYFEMENFRYPSAGTTIDWAYALLGGLVGLGALTLKNTGGTSVITEKIRGLTVR